MSLLFFTGLSQSIGISSSSSAPVSNRREPAVEFHQLPQKYRRAVISDYEMDTINVSGVDIAVYKCNPNERSILWLN